MKKKGTLLFVVLVLVAWPMGIYASYPPTYPASPGVSSAPNVNNMMGPASYNTIGNALQLKEKAHSLFDQAVEQGLDVSEFEEILNKADALLEKAQKIGRVNPIPATNMAREALGLYEDVISDLEALLG